MAAERTRPPGPAETSGSASEPRVAPPASRAGTPSAAEATYSEEQVAAILQRAAHLERGRAEDRPGLSLSEVEAIARDAGLDASLVRVAARSLNETERAGSLGARIAGAPIRRVFERVIDREIDVSHHERLVGDLRAGVAPFVVRSPLISAVGRTLTLSGRTAGGVIELTLAPRDGKTFLRIDVSTERAAGGLFGGLMGGLGGGLTPLAIALAVESHQPVIVVVAAGAGVLGAAFALARGVFSSKARSLYRRVEQLADAIERRVREEVGGRE